MSIKINGAWSQLSIKHITCMESAGHSLIFHMNDKRSFKAQAGFKDYQSLLDLNKETGGR